MAKHHQMQLMAGLQACNYNFPITRYQGSKQKIVDRIWKNISHLKFETFLDIVNSGFKDRIVLSTVWLFFYSFPFLAACMGALAEARASRWNRKLTS